MKHTLSLLLLFSAFTATTVDARLGETPAECVARYGEPVKIDKENSQLIFQKGAMLVIAAFHNDKCDMLGFRKAATNSIGVPEELTDNEIEVLRDANSGGKPWIEREGPPLAKVWATEDGLLHAQFHPLDRFLVICTRERINRDNAAKQEAERKKLNGF